MELLAGACTALAGAAAAGPALGKAALCTTPCTALAGAAAAGSALGKAASVALCTTPSIALAEAAAAGPALGTAAGAALGTTICTDLSGTVFGLGMIMAANASANAVGFSLCNTLCNAISKDADDTFSLFADAVVGRVDDALSELASRIGIIESELKPTTKSNLEDPRFTSVKLNPHKEQKLNLPQTHQENSVDDTKKDLCKQDEKQSEKEKKPSKQPPRRRKSQEVDDPSSETADTLEWQHIVDRFTRFIRFGGIIEMISELTGIPKKEVVEKGRSKNQDRSSKRGPDYHAAHVIRAGEINEHLQRRHYGLYEFLRNILGHTQVVPNWVNVWHRIGGDIDRFQEQFLEELCEIDFRGNLNSEITEQLTSLKNEYLSIIEKFTNLENDEDKKEVLKKAKEALEEISIEELFEKGKKGREGEYNESYMRK